MSEPLPEGEVPQERCKQCDHLMSFHNDDGCGTWLLGVRAVPLYRCACVHSRSMKPKPFPIINPPNKPNASAPFGFGIHSGLKANEHLNKAQVIHPSNLIPASEASKIPRTPLLDAIDAVSTRLILARFVKDLDPEIEAQAIQGLNSIKDLLTLILGAQGKRRDEG